MAKRTLDEIRNLMEEWAKVPTLSFIELDRVKQLQLASLSVKEVEEFHGIKNVLCSLFWPDIATAITKARQHGVGQNATTP